MAEAELLCPPGFVLAYRHCDGGCELFERAAYDHVFGWMKDAPRERRWAVCSSLVELSCEKHNGVWRLKSELLDENGRRMRERTDPIVDSIAREAGWLKT